jgi:dihydrodipicolinate synthase/N-acetylneuraminate lyase
MWGKADVCERIHPLFSGNIITVVDSCGNVGKLTRIADAVTSPTFASLHPRKNPAAPFLVLGGYIDFLVPSAYANGHGAITGLANLFPVSPRPCFSGCCTTPLTPAFNRMPSTICSSSPKRLRRI